MQRRGGVCLLHSTLLFLLGFFTLPTAKVTDYPKEFVFLPKTTQTNMSKSRNYSFSSRSEMKGMICNSIITGLAEIFVVEYNFC